MAGFPVPVLAVDGPSGSGKGTVCRNLATRLGWHLLDSGALYRLTAVAGHRAGLGPDDRAGHAALAARMAVVFAVIGAFYYLRVLEIPTPRWTAYDAAYFKVKMDPNVPMVTQERAFTSPIWYSPI